MAELQAGKVMVGHKIRRLRNTLKLSQSDMAAELGISTSYLNLLENNARPVTVPILFRLGQTYDIDLREMAEDDSSRLTALLTDALKYSPPHPPAEKRTECRVHSAGSMWLTCGRPVQNSL